MDGIQWHLSLFKYYLLSLLSFIRINTWIIPRMRTITSAVDMYYGGPIGRAMCRLPCDDVHATIDDVDATIDDVDVTIGDVDVTIDNVDMFQIL